MHKRKIKTSILIIILFLSAFAIGTQLRADDAGSAYSNKSSDIIGAWYDESWEASVFYRTISKPTGIPTTASIVYAQTFSPETLSNPTYSIAPNLFSPTLPGPAGQGEQIIPGASVKSDMVVTEWKVTGHVHFKSGL